jgi:hypothetical protein
MSLRIVLASLSLLAVVSCAAADDDLALADVRKLLEGKWMSGLSRPPGSADGLIQQTLEFLPDDKSPSVRLSWALYCGASRITGDQSFAGRLVSIQKSMGRPDKQRLLIFAGPKDARYAVEFTLSGDELQLAGKINEANVSDHWRRAPPAKK